MTQDGEPWCWTTQQHRFDSFSFMPILHPTNDSTSYIGYIVSKSKKPHLSFPWTMHISNNFTQRLQKHSITFLYLKWKWFYPLVLSTSHLWESTVVAPCDLCIFAWWEGIHSRVWFICYLPLTCPYDGMWTRWMEKFVLLRSLPNRIPCLTGTGRRGSAMKL